MGKSWDSTGIAYNVDMWKECLRVLKPGGYLLAFGGTRTYHRMACAIEDAGFEIRDQIQWIYGSGFPKSLNIGKAVDDLLGNEREVIGSTTSGKILRANGQNERPYQQGKERIVTDITKGSSAYEGWGTALKPANEPICMARKPLSEKTVAENVLKWGTGGINIDECRVATDEIITNHSRGSESAKSKGKYGDSKEQETHQTDGQSLGRFPANIVLDEEAGKLLDTQSGVLKSGDNCTRTKVGSFLEHGGLGKAGDVQVTYGESGGASRFFYCAKANKKERGDGNNHPTVKPLKLMEYLIKLITPPNGICLDPFAGSGTTGVAAINIGQRFIGIETDTTYCGIIVGRIQDIDVKYA